MNINGVSSVVEARLLFARVCQWAERMGMRFGRIPLEIRLCARRSSRPGCLGTTLHHRRWRGRKLMRNRIRGMELVTGLAPLLFQGVVAHELGHVWLAVHRIFLPQQVEEGFCELLAHRFYSDSGTEEGRRLALEIEINPDALYGAGFRYVRDLLGPHGLERVLKERRFHVRVSQAVWAPGGDHA